MNSEYQSELVSLGSKDFNVELYYSSGQNTLTNLFSRTAQKDLTLISAFIFIAKIGNRALLIMATKLQMLLYSKPNVLSYWCGTIDHIKHEFYRLRKLEPPRFTGLSTLFNKKFLMNK